MDSLFTLANAPFFWLLLGAVLLALEAFGASGIGFLFAGLGAITAAVAAHLALAESWLSQTAWFFAATVLWAVLLWVPLKKLRAQRHAGLEPYNNMVGDEATVLAGGLHPGKAGKVRWSGTTMSARLTEGAAALEEGAIVTIKEVRGTVLIVAPQEE